VGVKGSGNNPSLIVLSIRTKPERSIFNFNYTFSAVTNNNDPPWLVLQHGYTLKELPQPQVRVTFGLLNLKPAPARDST